MFPKVWEISVHIGKRSSSNNAKFTFIKNNKNEANTNQELCKVFTYRT